MLSYAKIAILVEYDALPEIGHGCGHCASGSISLLSALVLNELKEQFDGQIDIIGTPDEEVMGGKISMAKKGVFEGYDYAIMIHMNNKENAVYSKFLALDGIKIDFFGKTSHASSAPWEGLNAMNAIQLFFHGIDMMRQHIKSDVRIHGIIKEGGKAPNIVPDYSCAEVYTRSIDRKYLNEVSDWVKKCAEGAALATKTKVEISDLCPSLKNLTRNEIAETLLKNIYEDEELEVSESVSLGSSDIGELDDFCPAFHPLISIGKEMELHTIEFANKMTEECTHNAILKGGIIMTKFILITLNNEDCLKNIKNNYIENKK